MIPSFDININTQGSILVIYQSQQTGKFGR